MWLLQNKNLSVGKTVEQHLARPPLRNMYVDRDRS